MGENSKFYEAVEMFRASHYDIVQIIDGYHIIEGPIIYKFRANLPRDPRAVKRFFGLDEEHKLWKHMSQPNIRDWVVVCYGEEKFYCYPLTPMFLASREGRLKAFSIKRKTTFSDKNKLREQIWGPVIIKSGQPCGHRGCAQHISHPCEGCGRTGARGDIHERHFL